MSTQMILSGLRIAVLYAVGIFTALLCVFSLSEGQFLPGLFFGIAALWILPVTQRFLNAKFRFPRWVNWAAPISALLVALIALGMSLPTPNACSADCKGYYSDNSNGPRCRCSGG